MASGFSKSRSTRPGPTTPLPGSLRRSARDALSARVRSPPSRRSREVRAAGGQLIVMPHGDTAVIKAAKRQGMVCVPGVATPTEAFAALAAGADGLKMFPSDQLPASALKAWRAVLPRETLVFPVGGIRPENMGPYWAAGASGFGTGSNLYTPGATIEHVRSAAAAYAAAFRALQKRPTPRRPRNDEPCERISRHRRHRRTDGGIQRDAFRRARHVRSRLRRRYVEHGDRRGAFGRARGLRFARRRRRIRARAPAPLGR